MTFYVETYRPAWPSGRKLLVRVHRGSDYSAEVLSPSMTAVFEVCHVRTKQEAVAAVAEKAAGLNVAVHLIAGGRP